MKGKGNTNSKSILKKVSVVMMIAGVIVFFVGFILQFVSIATMAERSVADGMPNNYFAVIVTGFALLFSGVMVGAVDSMMKTRDIHVDMVETIRDKVMKGMHERMCEPIEKYCEYCGTLLHEGERECPNCGASKTKK